MIISKKALDLIRHVIANNYSQLIVSVLGRGVFTDHELAQLRANGVDTSNEQSLLSLVYNNALINPPKDNSSPTTISEMQIQQLDMEGKHSLDTHEYTKANLNDKTRQYLEKLKQEVSTRIDSIIRENNDDYKRKTSLNPDQLSTLDELMQESSLGKIKQKLRDSAREGSRDWDMIAVTELSNALGLGSADRIVADNLNSNLDEVYVYRISIADSKTCKFCRKFYSEANGSPKVYRMSTLLNNGSNYGKKSQDWKAVTVATHPRERCSSLIELKPGWALTESGTQTYIGLEKWTDYINKKVHD